MKNKIVLQKYISSSGYCSRRQAEELIRLGQVIVNGKVAELGMRVGAEDEVKVNGGQVKPEEEKVYIILNKPVGYVCSNRKFHGEKSVFDLFKEKQLQKLHVAGRLDKNSQGLVLFTNDGELTEKITHPRYAHEKEYIIQLKIKNEKLRINLIKNIFLKGVDIGDGDGVVKAKKVEELPNGKFRIILTTGKKRQIRRMFAVLGQEVLDLKRVRLGKLELHNLKTGEWKKITKDQIL